MTYREALKRLTQSFEKAGLLEAKADAFLLFNHITGYDRTKLLLEGDKEIEASEKERLEKAESRRLSHEPVQYIIESANFMGFDMRCTSDCLIPRFDTEILAQKALSVLEGMHKPAELLDLCTGSGCIAIALTILGKTARTVACDLSEEALKLACENARVNGAKIEFIRSDLFKNITGSFDLITANPPYIKSSDIPGLLPEVCEHEPMLALDGGVDGLYFYRKIADEARNFLRDGCYLIVEIGDEQSEAVENIFRINGYEDIHTLKDLAGLDRVVYGKKN